MRRPALRCSGKCPADRHVPNGDLQQRRNAGELRGCGFGRPFCLFHQASCCSSATGPNKQSVGAMELVRKAEHATIERPTGDMIIEV